MRWELIPPSGAELALTRDISEKFSLAPSLALILLRRSLDTETAIRSFLHGSLSDLPDPFRLSGMEAATARVARALAKGESILLFGDYDVDGITSASQLFLFLREMGARVEVLLPHRQLDGYGLSESSRDKIAKRKPDLLITLDNGTRSVEAISRLKSHGMDVIVIDHHESPSRDQSLPVEALINPKTPGQDFPDPNMASAGLVFLFLIALRSRLRAAGQAALPNLKRYLDLACLGTIADVVPLTGTNRLLVRFGLEEIASTSRPGLRALKDVAGVDGTDPVTSHAVAFRLAPRINAAGRMAHPETAFQLLTADSEAVARARAQELDTFNRERQNKEEVSLHEAFEMVETFQRDRHGLVVASDRWHLGVVGIMAARLVDKYQKPSVVLSIHENLAKGSARTVPGFSVHDALHAIEPLMKQFGGHDAAAGLAVDTARLEEFSAAFHESVLKKHPGPFEKVLKIDARPSTEELTLSLARQLSLLEPFGAGNPEPVFMLENVSLRELRPVGTRHLKFLAVHNTSYECIYFNGAAQTIAPDAAHRIAFVPQINRWNGRESLQLKIRDISGAS